MHNDVTYDGWGKTSAACHRECMGNCKHVLKRSKTDRLHVLLIAIFISESNCIGVRCVVKIACKVANGSADVSHYALSGKWLRLNL